MSKNTDFLTEMFEEYRDHPVAIAQEAILDLVAQIIDRMEVQGINRSELGRRADLAPAQVTRILSGEHNVTVGTLGKIASALDMKISFSLYSQEHMILAQDVNETRAVPATPPLDLSKAGEPSSSYCFTYVSAIEDDKPRFTGKKNAISHAA